MARPLTVRVTVVREAARRRCGRRGDAGRL